MRKRMVLLTIAACLALLGPVAAVAEGGSDMARVEAVYLGVKDYGAEAVNKDAVEDFLYRFLIDGEETLLRIDSGAPTEDGFEYPIQNRLKENYAFEIAVEGGVIVSAEEAPGQGDDSYQSPVNGVPGERTLANFLKTAMEPVGTTLYIYGGGWDWQDVGSAVQARTLGVSPDWVRFFREQDESFTYKSKDGDEANTDPASSYYPYGGYNEYYYAGLDCSGYLGWAVYNTLETESGRDGYVGGAIGFAKRLAGMGFGEWTHDVEAPTADNGDAMKPGDVISINGHVWISLGTCADGSVLILHSTPASSRAGQPGGGVELSAIGASEDCEAYRLADQAMSEHYPEWYERYPVKLCDPAVYFAFEGENAGCFTWDTDGDFSDPEGVQAMTPAQVLDYLFAE